MGTHNNSGNSMGSWLFRSEHKLELPKDWRLDPHADRYRHHTHHIEPPWCDITTRDSTIGAGLSKQFEIIILLNRNATCHPVDQLGGKWYGFSNPRSVER